MARQKTQKDWWKSFFGSLAGQIMFDPREAQSKKEVIEVLRHTGTKDRASVLDLACGEGRHSIVLAKKGFDVVGLDYSRVYLAKAKRKAVKSKFTSRLRFQQG